MRNLRWYWWIMLLVVSAGIVSRFMFGTWIPPIADLFGDEEAPVDPYSHLPKVDLSGPIAPTCPPAKVHATRYADRFEFGPELNSYKPTVVRRPDASLWVVLTCDANLFGIQVLDLPEGKWQFGPIHAAGPAPSEPPAADPPSTP